MLDADTLAHEAAALLADALRRWRGREHHRRQLERVIKRAKRVLAVAEHSEDATVSPHTVAVARLTLVRAYAARARDACYGAGQLSRGSQRAPTVEACDDGWQRVASIVDDAERFAREATRVASELDTRAAAKAAEAARIAAAEARRIIDERNHAYTFHADPGFSFGEGWYLAAASVLAGVAIQIEPEQPQSAQAERFLRDAGLGARLGPYRPRPRSNKHLTEIVARAFRRDPLAAQRSLRAAFLGDEPTSAAIAELADAALAGTPEQGGRVMLWVRYAVHHPTRNTDHGELCEIARRARATGLQPVLFGDTPRGELPPGTVDLTLCWRRPLFQGIDMRRAQLALFEHMRREQRLVGQIGVTTAGMDGPALLGLETLYLTDEPNVRMRQWVGAVPGYVEIVRDGGYLERIDETLRRWATAARGPRPEA